MGELEDVGFLRFVVESLVDNPREVKIERSVDEMGVLLTLTVDKNDMGKIIGRSGATAKAMRTLLRVVGMKNGARVNLKIEEPAGSNYQPAFASGESAVDDIIDDLKSGR